MKPGFGFVLVLALFAGLTTSGMSLLDGKLYWDTGKIFTQFRDVLHSLNVYGEIAWWAPHHQSGSPGYYHSLLGIPSCLNPMFAIVALVVWVLGRVGIVISHYQPLYVLYFGFLVPFFFLHALWLLARRLFHSPQVVRYVLLLGAFSPGILFNLSDVGYLEPSIYSLYFACAYWDFLKKSDARSFHWLTLSVMVLALTANHAFLYWNLFAVPGFVIACGVKRGLKALSKIALSQKVVLVLLAGLCFLPNALAYQQGRELVRSSLGETKTYPFQKIAPGNPLEMLSVSLPGFGFDWSSDREKWSLMPLSNKYHTAYYYLGLLCLPLVFLGLLFGNRVLRTRLLYFAIFFFGVASLSAYSPLFALILQLPTPLRSCNHFSDAAFKAGGYLILIFAAGLGLKTLQQNRNKSRTKMLSVFAFTSFCALMTHLYYFDKKVMENLPTGTLLFFTTLFTISLVWFLQARRPRQQNEAIKFLLIIAFLDLGTHSFLWVRNVWSSTLVLNSGWPAYHFIDETPGENGLGMKRGSDRHFYANLLLMYPNYFRMLMQGFNPLTLPETALFFEAHSFTNLQNELEVIKEGPAQYRSLGISEADAPEFKSALNAKSALPPMVAPITNLFLSYNERKFTVSSPVPALLFIRDAYSPYWFAEVSGKKVPIARAMGNFKAIAIPAGVSEVRFRFSPPGIGLSIFLAYFVVLTWLGKLLVGFLPDRLRWRWSLPVPLGSQPN